MIFFRPSDYRVLSDPPAKNSNWLSRGLVYMRLTILLKFIAACLLISQTTYAESFLKELEKKREAEFKIHTSPNKGFSLIELMVVIIIIALLTAISIPKIAYLNIRAARAELYVNMRGIFTHVQSFRAEHERYPSTIGVGGSFSMYSGDTLIDV